MEKYSWRIIIITINKKTHKVTIAHEAAFSNIPDPYPDNSQQALVEVVKILKGVFVLPETECVTMVLHQKLGKNKHP